MSRTILHSDMNCFYASVEMLHHPELAGKPMAVGGDPEARHGIVLTANYIAKRAGVKTGMALWQARQVCPEIIFVPPRMDLYLRFSRMAQEIYSEYTDQREPFGIDESWLDVTASTSIKGDGMKIAKEILNFIFQLFIQWYNTGLIQLEHPTASNRTCIKISYFIIMTYFYPHCKSWRNFVRIRNLFFFCRILQTGI